MSKYLDRFRSLDTRKLRDALGIEGVLTLADGTSVELTAISRERYEIATPLNQSFQNNPHAIRFVTSDLPTQMLRGCQWQETGEEPKEIVAVEPYPQTGTTVVTLTEI